MSARDERLTEGEGVESAQPRRQSGNGNGRAQKRAAHMADSEDDDRDHVERDMAEGNEEDVSDDERFEMFLGSLDQSVLPDLPSMPGYHVCWLTTTNPRDPVARRMRMGYQLIRVEEIGSDWDGLSVSTAGYQGVVGINEMVAAKIPLRIYNRYMQELHHNRPLGDEEKLRANLDLAQEKAESYGARTLEGEGFKTGLVQRAPVPDFAT